MFLLRSSGVLIHRVILFFCSPTGWLVNAARVNPKALKP